MAFSFPNEFEPREYQKPFMRHFIGTKDKPLDGRGKRATWVVHRRGGKDMTGMHTLNICAHRRRAAYWHTFPTFEQGRKAIWEGFTRDGKRIIDNVFPAELIKSRDNQQMKIELKCGSIYRLVGTDKIETVGAGPAGVLHSEYSIAKPSAADLIAPMLRENDGWEAYVYTPRGNNHGKKRFDSFAAQAKTDPRYFAQLLTLFDTRAYDPERTIAEERANGRPEALIRQEYLCDWSAANVGAVFGDLVPDAQEFDHPSDGVYTNWDLGLSDACAIWFWRVRDGTIDLIDYEEANGKPFEYFADLVDEKRYAYMLHFFPHDARARTFVTGSTTQEAAQARWPGRVGIVPGLSLADGIQAGRWLLQQRPRFHVRTAEGVEALRAYHYEWDDDAKVLAKQPMHDWSSHCADAFRYTGIVAKYAMRLARPKAPPVPPTVMLPNEGHRLDDLWKSSRSGGRERI